MCRKLYITALAALSLSAIGTLLFNPMIYWVLAVALFALWLVIVLLVWEEL